LVGVLCDLPASLLKYEIVPVQRTIYNNDSNHLWNCFMLISMSCKPKSILSIFLCVDALCWIRWHRRYECRFWEKEVYKFVRILKQQTGTGAVILFSSFWTCTRVTYTSFVAILGRLLFLVIFFLSIGYHHIYLWAKIQKHLHMVACVPELTVSFPRLVGEWGWWLICRPWSSKNCSLCLSLYISIIYSKMILVF